MMGAGTMRGRGGMAAKRSATSKRWGTARGADEMSALSMKLRVGRGKRSESGSLFEEGLPRHASNRRPKPRQFAPLRASAVTRISTQDTAHERDPEALRFRAGRRTRGHGAERPALAHREGGRADRL